MAPTRRLADFFILTAGKDRTLLTSTSARARAVSQGIAIWVTTFSAGGSILVALTMARGFHRIYFVPAVVWAVAVFAIDRSIVSATHGKNWLVRVISGLPRVAIAVVFGLLIAEPVMLWFFQPEIAAQLAHDTQSQLQGAQVQADATVAKQRQALQQRENGDNAAILQAEQAASQAQQALAAHAATFGTSDPVFGELEHTLGLANAKVETTQEFVAADEASAQKGLVALYLQAAATAAKEAPSITSDHGLLAREQALDELIRQHPSLNDRRRLIQAGILLIDVMPAVLAILVAASAHDRIIAAREELESRAAESLLKDADSEEAQDLAIYRRRVAAETEKMRIDAEATRIREKFAGSRKDTGRRSRRPVAISLAGGAALMIAFAIATLGFAPRSSSPRVVKSNPSALTAIAVPSADGPPMCHQLADSMPLRQLSSALEMLPDSGLGRSARVVVASAATELKKAASSTKAPSSLDLLDAASALTNLSSSQPTAGNTAKAFHTLDALGSELEGMCHFPVT